VRSCGYVRARCKQLSKRENFKIKIRLKQEEQDEEYQIAKAGNEGLFCSAYGGSWSTHQNDEKVTSCYRPIVQLIKLHSHITNGFGCLQFQCGANKEWSRKAVDRISVSYKLFRIVSLFATY
jgi:hypothetical protein